MTVVVWDCETETRLPRGDAAERELAMQRSQVTVLCCLVFDSDDALVPGNWEQARRTALSYTFWRDVDPHGRGPFEGALALFDEADAIVAYNGFGFDLRVLSKYYGLSKDARHRRLQHRLKLLDPMVRIAHALDVRFPGLDDLLKHNGLGGKTSNGLEAIKMWEEGRREELEEYCAADVEGLAELVFLPRLKVWGCGTLPNEVHGVAAFLRARRALAPLPPQRDDWTLVETGAEEWVKVGAVGAVPRAV